MNPEGFWGYYLEGECNVRHKNIFDSAQHHPLVHSHIALCFVDASGVVVLELSFLDRVVLWTNWSPTAMMVSAMVARLVSFVECQESLAFFGIHRKQYWRLVHVDDPE